MRHDVSNFSTSVHVNKGRHKHSFKERVLVKALKIKVVPPRVNVWLCFRAKYHNCSFVCIWLIQAIIDENPRV